MSSVEIEKEQETLQNLIKFCKERNIVNQSYNKFERTYGLMQELNKNPLPIEETELINISSKELFFLKESIELMAQYLNNLGFEFLYTGEEVLGPIYEELEKRNL